MSNNIGVIRGVFDPVHKGHLHTMTNSFKYLDISKLYVIVKFIGMKDPIISVEQRIELIKLLLKNCDLPIDIIRQNVKGHVAELLELRKIHGDSITNICGSEKIIREMDVYGRANDTFGMITRPQFPVTNEVHSTAERKQINIVEIPGTEFSSTSFRENIKNNENSEQCLDRTTSQFIYSNGLYVANNNTQNKKDFLTSWLIFIDGINSIFPDIKLEEIKTPIFNEIQDRRAWREKYIRTILKAYPLKDNDLLNFVMEAEKIDLSYEDASPNNSENVFLGNFNFCS
ncbi:MAG: adenylyltransferase/cytidyltransferase family protein [Candidatus Gracilibacteria bacterium]|nr:adenylyltransferase/cytidyltransferase family protein [Candidatus Gracilibacteria bacterium]